MKVGRFEERENLSGRRETAVELLGPSRNKNLGKDPG